MKKIRRPNPREGHRLLIEALAVSILPCLPLLDLSSEFYLDWQNHLWMMGYFGAYLREHLSFPVFFNTSESVGIPFPIFYGFGFYRILGAFCGFLSPAISIRIFTYLFFVAQYFCILKTILKLNLSKGFASSVAWIVTLSVYPLTNIYNRSALPEFFATTALSISICLLYLTLLEAQLSKRLELTLLFTFVFGFSCFTHPITALWGSIFILLFFVPFLTLAWKDLNRKVELLGCGFLSFALTLMSLSPWIYSNIQFLGQFRVSSITKILFFTDSIDWFWTRISPIPFDRRTFNQSLGKILTPNLDAQTNVFLVIILVLFFVICIRQKKLGRPIRTLGALIGVIWLFFFSVSIIPEVAYQIPVRLRVIQFAYRFVTYQNLAALTGLLGLAWIVKAQSRIQLDTHLLRPMSKFLAVFVFASYIIKINHVLAIQTHQKPQIMASREYRNSTLQLPSNFYGLNDYSTAIRFDPIQRDPKESSKMIRLHPQGDSEFGMVPPTFVETDQPGWYATNVQAFPWNELTINGQKVVNPKFTGCSTFHCFAIFLPQGKNQITYSINPPKDWTILDRLSIITNLVLILSVIAAMGIRRSSLISKDLKLRLNSKTRIASLDI